MGEAAGTPPLDALRDLDHLLEELEGSERVDRVDLARLRDDMVRVLEHGEARAAIHSVLHALARGHHVRVTTTDEHLTPAQAAERLGISRKLVNKLLDAGQMDFYRLPQSSHKRIPAGEVIRVLDERDRTRAGVDAIMDAVAEADY